jgi:invasion protein IalB
MAALAATNALAHDTDTQPPKPPTLSETYDAWTVQCATTGQGDQQRRQCQMTQELLQQESRQRMLLFAIIKGEGNAKATLVLPFGLLLSEGIRIDIGQQEFARGSVKTCFPAGCIVEIELPQEAVAELQAGSTASVFMTAINNQSIKTDVSLKGFGAAISGSPGLRRSNWILVQRSMHEEWNAGWPDRRPGPDQAAIGSMRIA